MSKNRKFRDYAGYSQKEEVTEPVETKVIVEEEEKELEEVIDLVKEVRSEEQADGVTYDYKYLTGKLSFRYEAYKSEMRKYPELKDKCDEYCKALLSVINLTEDPKIILDSNEEFRRLSIISFETFIKYVKK